MAKNGNRNEYKNQWRADNLERQREKEREYMREYRSRPENVERLREQSREYQRDHKDVVARNSKKYRESHKEQLKEKRASNRESYNAYLNGYQAKKRAENKELIERVEELRRLLKRAEPEYEYPPLPKRIVGDVESERAYSRAQRARRMMKIEYYKKELEVLLEMKEKAGL